MSLGSQRVGRTERLSFTCIPYLIVKSVSFLVKTVPWFPMKFGASPHSTPWPTRTLSLFRTSPVYGHGQSLSSLTSPSHCCCCLIKIPKLFLCLFLSEYFCFPFLLSGSFPFALYIRHAWWLYARCPDLEFLEFLLVCGSGLALNTRYILREIWKVEVKQSHFKLSEWWCRAPGASASQRYGGLPFGVWQPPERLQTFDQIQLWLLWDGGTCV